MEQQKFEIATASKVECLTKAERMLNLALKAEAEGKALPDGRDKDTKFRQVEFALTNACKVENAAFDGRE